MKNKLSLLLTAIILVATIATIMPACKKKFDAPAGATDPNITVTHTIKQLKTLHTVSAQLDMITTDMVIAGVVIADDKSGNLYKEIYIQDSTGAIALELEATSLYATYPVGRKVFVNCKGLYITDYHRLMQLGYRAVVAGVPSIQGIPNDLIKNYVTGGSLNNAVIAKSVAQSALTTNMQDAYLGSLIQLSNYEFLKGDTSGTYGDTSAYKASKNLTIRDCSGNTIIIRTSGFANFAALAPAKGNGTIKAIYTTYDNTPQLLLRDTTDVLFTNSRCNLFEEDFQGYATTGTAALSIPGWKNIMETGDVPFTMASFGSSIFPKISAFSSTALSTTNISTWLISPQISLPSTGAPAYTFTCSRRYSAGTFKAYISTNYTGGTPASATWTLLATVPAGSATAFTPFDTFGPYNFTAYLGQKINIAFRYEAPAGTSPSLVGTYEPDDIKITR